MAIILGRAVRALAAVALGAGATLVLSGPAHAADTDAVVRGAHFSPTTPGVDVYLGPFSGGSSRIWLNSVSYGAVSPYQRLAPGLYTVSMRPAGTAPSTTPVLTWTLNAQAGKAYTVAGVGAGASVRGIVIDDDLTTPPAGQGRVRVIQAASRAPIATVTATNGPVIASNAAFASTTPYATVPAGTWSLSAQSSETASPVSTTSSVSVTAGVSTSLLILDAKTSGIELRTVLDSASSGSTPIGSVPAGGGGTAGLPQVFPTSSPSWATATGIGSVSALGVLVGVGVLRRRHANSGGRHALS
ncbi:MAG: cell wall protein [Pseudonocardiales bacterium]|nr:cell wall protein [Pseudonocardiales bacterium]